MTRNPSEPGLEIYSTPWFDNIFEGTKYNDPENLWIRQAVESICRGWALGNSSDPILIAEKLFTYYKIGRMNAA